MRHAPVEPSRSPWRLLIDGPQDGAANMAVDETLLEGYLAPGASSLPPTLRLYGWHPAALSLGKAQDAVAGHDPAFLRREGLHLVRRPTGGQAVLHEHERTYAVVGRLDRPPFAAGVLATYAAISEALRDGLGRLGVAAVVAERRRALRTPGPVCFNVPSSHELLHDGRKIVGSAQLRRGRAFLQHGSIPYVADADRLGAAIGQPADAARFTGLAALLGRRPADVELDAALVAGFERVFGIECVEDVRTVEERQRIERLRSSKYLSTRWTLHGETPLSDSAR